MIVKQTIGPALSIFTCLALIFVIWKRCRLSNWLLLLLPVGPVYTISAIDYFAHDFSHSVFNECSSIYGSVITLLSTLCGLLILIAFVVHVRTSAYHGEQ